MREQVVRVALHKPSLPEIHEEIVKRCIAECRLIKPFAEEGLREAPCSFLFVMALTLTTMAHCDAVGRGIHAINRVSTDAQIDSNEERRAYNDLKTDRTYIH